MLSRCFLDCSVGVGVFVTGLSQISAFFSWLHVPSGTPWFTSSDTHQVVEIKKETSTKMYTPF